MKTNFLDLPDDILGVIPNFFAPKNHDLNDNSDKAKTMANLSQTCRQLHGFYKPALLAAEAKQLLTYVLQGNATQAKKMYERKPALLFIEAEAREYASGFDDVYLYYRSVRTSPVRAMAAAYDIWMLKDALPTLRAYIDSTGKSGTLLAYEQITQQFPNGFMMEPSTYDFNNLYQLLTVKFNSKTKSANFNPTEAQEFKRAFSPKKITTGALFNLNHLIAAYQALQNFTHPPGYIGKLSDTLYAYLFCKVFGYLQRLLPAVDAQMLCRPQYKLDSISRGLKRLPNTVVSLWYFGNMNFYFDNEQDFNSRDVTLGHNCAITIYEQRNVEISENRQIIILLVKHRLTHNQSSGCMLI